MSDCCILLPMRLQSRRLPEKLLLSLNGVNLARRALETAKETAELCDLDVLAAVADPTLIREAQEAKVPVFERSPESVTDTTDGSDRFAGWADRLAAQNYKWVWYWNACFPLISPKTAAKLYGLFRDRPIRSVFSCTDSIIVSVHGSISEMLPSGRINKAKEYFVPTHWGMIIPVTWLDRPTAEWFAPDSFDLCLYERSPEMLDINTMDDWRIIRAYARQFPTSCYQPILRQTTPPDDPC